MSGRAIIEISAVQTEFEQRMQEIIMAVDGIVEFSLDKSVLISSVNLPIVALTETSVEIGYNEDYHKVAYDLYIKTKAAKAIDNREIVNAVVQAILDNDNSDNYFIVINGWQTVVESLEAGNTNGFDVVTIVSIEINI